MRHALAAALLLSGCTVGPDYRPPATALPPVWSNAAAITPAVDADWWAGFGDPLLPQLITRALANGTDVEVALARVAQARAAAQAAGAALLPSIDATGDVQTVSQSLRTPIGRAVTRLGGDRNYTLMSVGAQAAWELDLAGGLRRRREAAQADAAATALDLAAVRVSVAAEVADAYVALRALQARLAVAEGEADSATRFADLVGQRVEQGLSAAREGNRAVAERERVRAAVPPLRAAIAAQMNRLDVLLGEPAGSNRALLAPAAAVPIAPPPAGSLSPAELLRRRPDIAAVERRVAAGNARIGAAMAEYYPSVSLAGLVGVASIGTSRLFTGDALQASAGAGLRWRLFDFGRVDAEVAGARGVQAEALARWRSAVLTATGEVETALARLAEARATGEALARQIAALRAARDQSRDAYAAGLLPLLDVIDADRALLAAEDALALTRGEQARAAIAAFRALGGGWAGEAPSTTMPS